MNNCMHVFDNILTIFATNPRDWVGRKSLK